MCKIIKHDMFNIIFRLKRINSKYFIMYNTSLKRYEIHFRDGFKTHLEMVVPYKDLDGRILKDLIKNSTNKIDNIINEIDNFNLRLQKEKEENLKERLNYKTKIIMKKEV